MKSGSLLDNSEPGPAPQRLELPNPAWKRPLDLGLILLSAPITILLGAVIACVIKLSSRGPLIFRQERIGLRGERFLCLKFRTMKVDAEHASHRDYLKQLISSQSPMTKLDLQGDRRLIPGGAWLRATGLDELPQLVNIWRGEMSLVGPRPCLPYEFEEHSASQKHRYDALPGLTGLWQVSGKNSTTFTEMVELDIWYAGHRSLWLDLKIIARTPFALLEQVVAARRARPPRAAQPKPAASPNPAARPFQGAIN
jgi:lipopolysaccharide/colanic/teichoic acid biosynthesis glycosyltransferase